MDNKKNIKTVDNIKFGDMSATARMNYLKMLDKKNKTKQEEFANKLYGATNK